MAEKQLFANNAGSMLAVSIDDNDLSLQVGGGHGALFPLPAAGEFFKVTLMDASGNREVVKVTSRSTDVFTIVRAQEGTSAQAWTQNACRVEARLTKESMEQFLQVDGDFTAEGDFVWTGEHDFSGGSITGALNFNDAGNLVLSEDNKELRFGAGGDDLAIYHDSIDNYIDSNTGDLYLRNALSAHLKLESDAAGFAELRGTGPSYRTYETDADADEKLWGMGGDASGAWTLRTRADDGSVGNSAITVSRNGTTVDTVRLLGETRIDLLHTDGAAYGGSYEPNPTAITNLTSVAEPGTWLFQRLNNIVAVHGAVDIDAVAAGEVAFDVDLPIAADLDSTDDASGIASCSGAAGSVNVDAAGDQARIRVDAPDGTPGRTVHVSFMYRI